MPNYPEMISGDSLHMLRSYCRETMRQSFTWKFSVHPTRKNYVGWKNDSYLFNDLDVLYDHAKFEEDLTMRAGCSCKKCGACVFLFTLCAKLSGAVYCNRSCLWVGLFVGLCGSVTTITRNCVHRSSPNSTTLSL